MGREIQKLSARGVAALSKPGRHSDGAGLYLVVDASGAKRWLFMFRWAGRLKEMGLGGIASVSLADARGKADAARRVLGSGRNPIEERRQREKAGEGAVLFGDFADKLVEELSKGFRNEKHRRQWAQTLTTFAAPLRSKGLDEIRTDDVLSVLTPIWAEKNETASRLRGRIERVLDAAKARGLRTGENPARWRGHLDQLLSRRRKLTRGHHQAMPFANVPAFVTSLRGRKAVAALGLEFLILTAARSGEVLGVQWAEIDISQRLWTVPADRMKGGRIHRVPLSDRAMAVLAEVEQLRSSEFVFPGQRAGRPLSGMAFEMMLRRMKVVDATPHGFRSSFRDWAGEYTSFPREVAEASLAHVIGDEVERAYRRGDALEKRRQLMGAWSDFIDHTEIPSNVVRIFQAK